MAQSLYTAAAGLKAQQSNIDTIAHNIANVNTDGFRKMRAEFQEAAYTALLDPSKPANAQDQDLQRGSGALAMQKTTMLSPGPLVDTGNPLDVTVSNGYLMIEDAGGEVLYTKGGSFKAAEIDGMHYLTTRDGFFVLDELGSRIAGPDTLSTAEIDPSGRIAVGGVPFAGLGIRSFEHPSQLEAAGSGLWRETPASGAPVATGDGTSVRQGVVEGSNVDLGEELTRLMSAQRAYAFLSRAITASDAMSAVENDIRR
ncbi:MAG: flagellar hook-basal body protein [Clostridiaceae bacterium]|jgi:flagellar basal-body rod protein FlgG|nr:flagellar hook-basal body protein [Clostridiaceae bacterium]